MKSAQEWSEELGECDGENGSVSVPCISVDDVKRIQQDVFNSMIPQEFLEDMVRELVNEKFSDVIKERILSNYNK